MDVAEAFAVLGLAPNAEPEAIAGAYRALAFKYHPDRNPEGAEAMKRINAANTVLADPARRAAYQKQQESGSAGGSRWTPPPPPTWPPPRPSSAPPQFFGCDECGRPLRSKVELCTSCARRALVRALVPPALLLMADGSLTGAMWGQLGPAAPIPALMLVLAGVGLVAAVRWIAASRRRWPVRIAAALGWGVVPVELAIGLMLMPVVGLVVVVIEGVRLGIRVYRLHELCREVPPDTAAYERGARNAA